MDININLKKARQIANLTQGKLATAVGSSKSAISEYESGIKTPSLQVIQAIASATNKPLCWFFMNEAEQEKWEKDAQMSSEQVCQFAAKDETEQKFALEALELFKKYTE